jgi:hypothetical protein
MDDTTLLHRGSSEDGYNFEGAQDYLSKPSAPSLHNIVLLFMNA